MSKHRNRSRGESSSLLSRRRLLLSLVGGGLSGASTHVTGAFSNVAAKRETNIDTADDTSALVGVDVEKPVEATIGSPLVTVTNNTTERLRVDISLTEDIDGVTIPTDTQQQPIPSEREAKFTVDVNPAKQPDQIEFTLEAVDTATGDFSVSLSRSTPVEVTNPCAGPRLVIQEDTEETIDEGKTVELLSNVIVHNHINAAGCVVLNSEAKVKQSVEAGGNVSLGRNAKIKGSVNAGGDVSLGRNAKIKGSVNAGGDVSLGRNAKIKGSVNAGGDVSLGRNAKIKGSVNAGGDVSLGRNAKIKGPVDAGGTVSR
ncbi:polymer-forming protein [Haloarcula quadrata]|uniref:Polymer-forming protein n=1 Tax=Haloarcula quadrata TaxID=182779 RepID=A0A495QQM5_9EURY|nr:polymer-forming protein [Haloarcula quadrata]